MARYSNRTCAKCGLRRPIPQLKEITEHSWTGYSLGIYNVSSRSNARGGARARFSRKNIWVCHPSASCDDPDYYARQERQRAALRKKAEGSFGRIDGAITACMRHSEKINKILDGALSFSVTKAEALNASKKMKSEISVLEKELEAAHEEFSYWERNKLPDSYRGGMRELRRKYEESSSSCKDTVLAVDLFEFYWADAYDTLMDSGKCINKFISGGELRKKDRSRVQDILTMSSRVDAEMSAIKTGVRLFMGNSNRASIQVRNFIQEKLPYLIGEEDYSVLFSEAAKCLFVDHMVLKIKLCLIDSLRLIGRTRVEQYSHLRSEIRMASNRLSRLSMLAQGFISECKKIIFQALHRDSRNCFRKLIERLKVVYLSLKRWGFTDPGRVAALILQLLLERCGSLLKIVSS